VRKIVLENDNPFVPLLIERKAGETQLFVKQVKVEGVRYVVCRNEEEAENDRTLKDCLSPVLRWVAMFCTIPAPIELPLCSCSGRWRRPHNARSGRPDSSDPSTDRMHSAGTDWRAAD
jgi:hypothetical protein